MSRSGVCHCILKAALTPLGFERLERKQQEESKTERGYDAVFTTSHTSEPEEVVVESSIPTPSTEGLKPNGWLDEDQETGKERDYFYNEVCVTQCLEFVG